MANSSHANGNTPDGLLDEIKYYWILLTHPINDVSDQCFPCGGTAKGQVSLLCCEAHQLQLKPILNVMSRVYNLFFSITRSVNGITS